MITTKNLRSFLTIGAAAQKLGVHPDTLRRWEATGLVTSRRHPMNNYRLYCPDELEKIIEELQGEKSTSLRQSI